LAAVCRKMRGTQEFCASQPRSRFVPNIPSPSQQQPSLHDNCRAPLLSPHSLLRPPQNLRPEVPDPSRFPQLAPDHGGPVAPHEQERVLPAHLAHGPLRLAHVDAMNRVTKTFLFARLSVQVINMSFLGMFHKIMFWRGTECSEEVFVMMKTKVPP